MIVTVQPRQSVFDIALQHFGSPEAAFVVAEKIGCSITDELTAGIDIEFSGSEILDKRVVEYYRQNGIVPATDVIGVGIDYMKIGYDFIVA